MVQFARKLLYISKHEGATEVHSAMDGIGGRERKVPCVIINFSEQAGRQTTILRREKKEAARLSPYVTRRSLRERPQNA